MRNGAASSGSSASQPKPRQMARYLILILSAVVVSPTAGEPSPDLGECNFCRSCEGTPSRRKLPEFYPGVELTPRLSRALFGSASVSTIDQTVEHLSVGQESHSKTWSHVHIQSTQTVKLSSLQHRHQAVPAHHAEAEQPQGTQYHEEEAAEISEGYDDDDFFQHESLFPEDELNSIQYAESLARQGYMAVRRVISSQGGKSNHTHPSSRRTLRQSDAKAKAKVSGSEALPVGDGRYTYMPSKDSRANLTMCETCSGCTSEIGFWGESAKKIKHKAGKFTPPTGRSSTWVFRAPSAKAAGGTAVAKVWCLPFKKGPGIRVDECRPATYQKIMGTLLGFAKLATDCGMQRVVPNAWVEHIRALMPGTDYVVDLPALLSDVAPGVSARFLSRGADRQAVLDIFQSMKAEDVVLAAIFDLLVANCDRHADNIFIGDEGQLTLIDNDMSLSGKCIADSLFLPGTRYHAKASLSDPDSGKARASVLDLLDYRCHADGGALQTSYPPPVTKCLKKLDSMSVADIIDVYGFANTDSAAHLKLRAQQMLDMGFEWTLHKSLLHSGGCGERHLARQPCCKFRVGRKGKFVCDDPKWSPRAHQVGSDCQL